MTIDEARQVILRRFMKAARVTDLTEEHLLDDYPGDVSALVRALYTAGLLEKVRGATRGSIYATSPLGQAALAEPPS